MLKHAYLIIAHNEFEVLQKLIFALDDYRNDIYIHFDAKVEIIPKIDCQYSALFILHDRINVTWGDVSQIQAEYKLWEAAVVYKYSFYHLISGTHFPLKGNSDLYMYFEKHGKSIFHSMETSTEEIDMKIRRYNVLSKYMMSFRYGSKRYMLGRLGWNLCHKLQKIMRFRRYKNDLFYKSSNWVSLTHEVVNYLIKYKKSILSKYKYTFCADEFFVLSELMNSPFKEQLIFSSSFLCQDWISTNPRIYYLADFDDIVLSGCLFARKFSRVSLPLLDKISDRVHGRL